MSQSTTPRRGLPRGLTINPSTGVITGSPRQAGIHTFTVRATDSLGTVARSEQVIQIFLNSVQGVPGTPPDAYNGEAYSWSIITVEGDAPYTYAIVALEELPFVTFPAVPGTMPSGLALASDGTVSGTPSDSAGSYSFFVESTDEQGFLTHGAFRIDLYDMPSLVGSFDTGELLSAYSDTLTVAGGKAPFTLANQANIPTGLSLGIAGTTITLSGTPTADGTYAVEFDVVDANSKVATFSQSVTIDPVFTPVDPPTFVVAESAFQTGLNMSINARGSGGQDVLTGMLQFLLVSTAVDAADITFSSQPGGNWIQLLGPVSVGDALDTYKGAKATLFYRILTEDEPANTEIVDPGSGQFGANLLTFSNVDTSAPINATGTATVGTASNDWTCPAVTVTVNKAMIAYFLAFSKGNTGTGTAVASFANASLTGLTLVETGQAGVHGIGIPYARGVLASAGSSGTLAGTHALNAGTDTDVSIGFTVALRAAV